MSSHPHPQPQPQPQPQPRQPTFPGFPRVFHALDTLKSHLVSLQQGLDLAARQQPYRQTYGHPPGPPPQYGLPPSPELSEAILHPHASVQDKGGPLQPHPHVYGHGYVQAQSFGGPSEQSILAQINAAREAIGPANAELNQAIGALRRGAEGVYERIGSNAAMGIPSLQAVEESYRQRDVEDQRDREKIASMDRELNKSPKDCVVM